MVQLLLRASIVVLGGLGLCACESAVAPTPLATATNIESGAALPPAGFYTMTFLHDGVAVTTLPAGPYAVSHVLIKVHVEDSNHQPAQSGSVLFERCRYPSGDPAPSSACANKTARWTRWIDAGLTPNGDAIVGYDSAQNPCTLGLRATYRRSKTIAPATLGPVDFTWW